MCDFGIRPAITTSPLTRPVSTPSRSETIETPITAATPRISPPISSTTTAVTLPSEIHTEMERSITEGEIDSERVIAADEILPAGKPAGRTLLPDQMTAINEVSSGYSVTMEGLPNQSDLIGPIGTREERLNALANITQVSKGANSEHIGDRCGAAALVGSAIYSGGLDGLSELTSATISYRSANGMNEIPELASLRERLSHTDYQPTQGDIALLQEQLYLTMNPPDSTVSSTTTRRMPEDILETVPAERRSLVMAEGLSYRNVTISDSNGSTSGHYVIGMEEEGRRMVYDPWPRRRAETSSPAGGSIGQQIVTDPAITSLYFGALGDETHPTTGIGTERRVVTPADIH